jgi:hypothetical protein
MNYGSYLWSGTIIINRDGNHTTLLSLINLAFVNHKPQGKVR